jgi:hypothetical protein
MIATAQALRSHIQTNRRSEKLPLGEALPHATVVFRKSTFRT